MQDNGSPNFFFGCWSFYGFEGGILCGMTWHVRCGNSRDVNGIASFFQAWSSAVLPLLSYDADWNLEEQCELKFVQGGSLLAEHPVICSNFESNKYVSYVDATVLRPAF